MNSERILDSSPDYTTPDGIAVYTRLIQPDDADLLVDLFSHLSPETRRRRFNVALSRVSDDRIWQQASELAAVDNQTSGGAVLALVRSDVEASADAEHEMTLVGVARLAREPGLGEDVDDGSENGDAAAARDSAEVAVVVRDDYQRRGIGSHLLQKLEELAREMGIHTLTASIQATNEPALSLLTVLDRPLHTKTRSGETIVQIHLQ